MVVSSEARPARAKVMAVSTPRTDEREKATGVSRERYPMYAGYGGAWPGTESTHRATHQRPGTAGVEGAGGTGGHGRASRSTTPSRQARVWRSRGRPGPTAPGTPAEPQATSSIANSGCTAGVKGVRGPGCGARNNSGAASNKLNRKFRLHRRCEGRKRARPQRPWAAAEPGRAPSQRTESTHRATHQRPGATVWRAPEGPEGTGGLRGAAPNEVRSPSLAGGRARRRPKHQRSRKQQAQ